MGAVQTASANVTQAVPFFGVTDIEVSLRFYVDGLGFEMKQRWIPEGQTKIRWCWVQRGGGALMLQEYLPERRPRETLGMGTSICFMCEDALALYREFKSRGVEMRQRPFVGNGLWVVSVADPDGYRIDFESPTDVAEETVLEE